MPFSLDISNWNFSRKLKLEKKKVKAWCQAEKELVSRKRDFTHQATFGETADRSVMGKDYHDGTA